MQIFKNIAQGGFIGIGNIIPGVSGATVALILGIYKQLISAIDSINMKTIFSIFKIFHKHDAFMKEMKRIQADFLLSIFVGVIVFVYIFSFAISYLLDAHHNATYSFFCGLILASVLFPFRYIKQKTWHGWIIAIFAIFMIVSVTNLGATAEEKIANHQKKIMIKQDASVKKISYTYKELAHYFLAGAIAISAMILPGISGSFILLLMGSYFDILLAIKQLNITILAVFGSGCLVGLLSFTKVLKILLEKYESELMFFLMGLILGSVYSIWPFKKEIIANDVVFYGGNILPEFYTFSFLICSVSFVSGIILVLSFYTYEKK